MREISGAGEDKTREWVASRNAPQELPPLHIGPKEPAETHDLSSISEPEVRFPTSVREQIRISRPETELTRPREVPRFPDSGLADHLVESAMVSAGKAMLWKAVELGVDTVAPGAGPLVRVTKIISEFRGAVKTYEQGQGFLVNLPLIDLPEHDFTACLRLRAFAKDPPPGLPADLGLDYVSTNGQLDRFNVVEGADAAPTNEVGPPGNELDPLFRHAQQLFAAAGVRSSEFRVPYLHQPTRTGWVVVQPLGEPTRCEAWFKYKLSLSLARQSELKTTCPLCGRIRSNEHECVPSDTSSSGGLPI